MELVAFLGKDKENWGQVNALLKKGEWEKVILIKENTFDEFPTDVKHELVGINTNSPLMELKEDIMKKLKPKVSGFEVALSIASGNGKEHMALISALLSIPVGIRFVVFTKNGVEFVN